MGCDDEDAILNLSTASGKECCPMSKAKLAGIESRTSYVSHLYGLVWNSRRNEWWSFLMLKEDLELSGEIMLFKDNRVTWL